MYGLRTPTSERELVKIKNLYFKYSKKDKYYNLEDVSFSILPNRFHIFIGENGAGKSTTIDNILRTKIIRNDDKSVYYKNGKDEIILKNNIDMLYITNIENKTNLFKSYDDTWRYTYNYVKINSIRMEH